MTNAINGNVLNSAMSRLVAERSKLDNQIQAIKTLTGYETVTTTSGGFHKRSGMFTAKIKEVLLGSPGATSTQIRSALEASGYTRPRAGGPLKAYDIPIALGRLAKSGQVMRVGGSRRGGFKYMVPTR